MSKEVCNEYTQPKKNVGFPIKPLVKEQRTRMIIALQSDPRFESTYWASLSLCALPFLTMQSTAVMLYEAGVEKILWCAEASRIVSMRCRGGVIDPHFTAVILFAVFFASRPPLARLHHPLLPIFLLAQRSGGPSSRRDYACRCPRLIPVPQSTRRAFVLKWQVAKSGQHLQDKKAGGVGRSAEGVMLKIVNWKYGNKD